jgi:PPOX class probable F420-dependent enzyme
LENGGTGDATLLNTDQAAALDRFSKEPIARLATVSTSRKPRIVPITFAIVGEFLFTMVDQKPKTTMHLHRLENIAQNPEVSLLADEYDTDWTRLWWVRIDGEAAVVESGSNWSIAQRLLMEKYHQYLTDPPMGPAIVVAVNDVTWWEWSPGRHAQ